MVAIPRSEASARCKSCSSDESDRCVGPRGRPVTVRAPYILRARSTPALRCSNRRCVPAGLLAEGMKVEHTVGMADSQTGQLVARAQHLLGQVSGRPLALGEIGERSVELSRIALELVEH